MRAKAHSRGGVGRMLTTKELTWRRSHPQFLLVTSIPQAWLETVKGERIPLSGACEHWKSRAE